VFLELAQAAVERENQRLTEPDEAWTARYAEGIAAAEALLTNLPENERTEAAPAHSKSQESANARAGKAQSCGG